MGRPPAAAPHSDDDAAVARTTGWRWGLILTVVGVVIAAAALTVQVATVPSEPAEIAAACRADHGIPDDRALGYNADTPYPLLFDDCAWPAPPGAGVDGYSEIVVRSVRVPGTSRVDMVSSVQVFETPCEFVSLLYGYNSMDSVSPDPYPAVVVQTGVGTTLSVPDTEVIGLPGELADLMVGDLVGADLYALPGGRDELLEARCVDRPPVS